MYSLQQLNDAYLKHQKENYSSNSELVGTLLGFSFAMFITIVLLTIAVLSWVIVALYQNRKKLKNWVIVFSIICILGVFVKGIGLFGPLLALLIIYLTREN